MNDQTVVTPAFAASCMLDLQGLQQFFDVAPTALIAVAQDGRIVLCNKLASDYFMHEPQSMPGLELAQLLPPPHRDAHSGFLQSFFSNPVSRAMGMGRELYGCRSDGSVFPMEVGLNPLLVDGKQLVVASILDISVRRKLEQRYTLAMQSLPEGLLIVGPSGQIIETNAALETMFGYSRRELVGANVELLMPPRFRQQHVQNREAYSADMVSRRMGLYIDLYGLRRDGSEFPVEIGLNPLDEGPAGSSSNREIVVTIIDISARTQLENERREFAERIQQVQRLEGLGLMAGGIAHDFNNILTCIVGNTELARMLLAQSPQATGYLDEVIQAAARAAALCKQMLAFTGRSQSQRKPLTLNALIADSHELIAACVSYQAQVDYRLDDAAPPLLLDRDQMQQVLMNLVTNAVESIAEGPGKVTISTGLIVSDRAELPGHSPFGETLPPGTYVRLGISDNGTGITPGDLKKLFDPFYTTKFTGRGLGLPAVLGIVRSHNGAILVDSQPGVGTTVNVLLPCPPVQELPTAASTTALAPKQGKVLLIDDEPSIVEIMTAILQREGFRVNGATDGRDGLRLFDTAEEPFDLVITDLIMPAISGLDIHRHVRGRAAALPVILISGYTQDCVEEVQRNDAATVFIGKPLSPATLLTVVRGLFSQASECSP